MSNQSSTEQEQTRFKLYPGGAPGSTAVSLWIINVAATTLDGAPIPDSQITVAGQVPDTNGNVLLVTTDNSSPIDVTAMTPDQDYFTLAGYQYKPQIQANGTNLDPIKTNATFCVGQQVTFSLVFSPMLPITNLTYNWTLPANFVNLPITNSGGCVTYTNDPSLTVTITNTCSGWFVNGPGGTATVDVMVILPNGKTASVSAAGQIAIYRPSVYMTSNDIIEPRYFTMTPNPFGGARVKLGSRSTGKDAAGQMIYSVRCDTEVSGIGEITQTCQLSYNPDSGGFNFSDWRCDGPENYDGPADIDAAGIYVFYPTFDDGPYNRTTFSVPSIEVKGNFIDYIRFNPNSPGSIYVTLGIVTWSMDALITNGPAGWTFVTTNTPDPVGPNNSDQFPFYTQPR